MNMSTDEALKYIADHQSNVEVESEEKQSSAQPSEETKAIAEPASDAADDSRADKPKDEKEDRQNLKISAGSDESAEGREEKAENQKAREPRKQERTHKEERDYAFIREKNKRKAQRERYEAEIRSLKAEIEKYKGLKLEDFKNDQQQYIDYLHDQDKQERKLADQESRLDELNAADMEAENDRRVKLSFADEKERQEYAQLLERNGHEFLSALKKFDRENVVMTYLNDLEQYPRVLKVLMTDKEALRSVFAKRDPVFRKLALDKLATNLLAPKAGQPAKTEKKKLPIIGRQTSSASVAENKVHDGSYWNEYLRNHPKGR